MKKLVKRALMVAGAIALAASLMNIVVPKAVHAAVAALVRDVDNPARDTFQATFQSSCSGAGNTLACTGGLTVPTTNGSGQPISMFVIEFVSGSCPTTSDVTFTNYSVPELITLSNNLPTTPITSTSGKFIQIIPQSANNLLASQTRAYAAPGTAVLGVVGGGPNTCTLTVSGYLVTP